MAGLYSYLWRQDISVGGQERIEAVEGSVFLPEMRGSDGVEEPKPAVPPRYKVHKMVLSEEATTGTVSIIAPSPYPFFLARLL